ncbi:MAG: kynurenine 3-monooxygenase [Flavobacteriales bacterium]|nr:FAD-dependent monooxygenase [Bacteroidales bacterium AH-315-I05]PCJ90034.1 MAG: kynurenine 3-monooxygenase [Flavobacteriales bacterium]
MKKVTIVGAGLVGSLQAVYMAKRGWQVEVFERRPDLRKAEIDAGRSINLVVARHGWKSLEEAGIADEIRKLTIPVYGRMIHDEKGDTNFQPYSVKGKAIHSVSRSGLNAKLMDCAEQYQNVKFHFSERCSDVDLNNATAIFENSETGKQTNISADLIIGADGAYSEVRHRMMMTDRFNYSQQYIEHGYKEIHFPPNDDGTPKMQQDALHIWPRKNYMLMGLSNLDGGFTGTLFFPFESDGWSFGSIKTENDVTRFFEEVFPDAIPLIPNFAEQYFANPTSSLVIVRCYPWTYKNVMLIGDAAHAIVPFYGEGMNCGFEDCFVFDQLMDEFDEDLNRVLPEYGKSRKPNGDAIADLSMRNFIEMRDLVADPQFVLRKKIEAKIYAQYPEKWIPLYSQVKFTDIPYSEALKEGQRQDEIMKKILRKDGIMENWDSEDVEREILEMI